VLDGVDSKNDEAIARRLNGGWISWLRIDEADGIFYILPDDCAWIDADELKTALQIESDVDLSKPAFLWGSDVDTFWELLGDQGIPTSVLAEDYGAWVLEQQHKERSGLKRTAQQEAVILAEIRKLGFDPSEIPRPARGYPGVKSDVRQIVLTGHLRLFTPSSFEKAWDRLRRAGQIKDAE
jgi:hypothetical protein